jgi:Tfp pilus assembly protein PilV
MSAYTLHNLFCKYVLTECTLFYILFFMQQPKPVVPKTYSGRQTRNTTAADAAAADATQQQETTKPVSASRLKKKTTKKFPKQRFVCCNTPE